MRRRWLGEAAYADLVALCQFLPGPTSSQVGMALGLSRAGYAGAAAAWVGFTLPSAIALVLFAYGVAALGDVSGAGWLHGFKVAAVAVVAIAVLGMARTLTPDKERAGIAVVAAAIALAVPTAWGRSARSCSARWPASPCRAPPSPKRRRRCRSRFRAAKASSRSPCSFSCSPACRSSPPSQAARRWR